MKAKLLKSKILTTLLVILLMATFVFRPVMQASAISKASILSKASAGLQEAKGSFDGAFTPSWFLTKFGITGAFHLIDCIENKKKPSVRAVIKSMMTANYVANSIGGMLGCAAGSFMVPFLSSVPIVGGLLADFVPTIAFSVGANLASGAVDEARSGKFSIKNIFKNIDWIRVISGSIGWAAGSLLCTAICPPIGGLVGGIAGNYIVGKLVSRIRKFFGKTDNSPPGSDTGQVGGPIVYGQSPEKSVYSVSQLAPKYLPREGVSLKATGKMVVLRKRYQELYKSYVAETDKADSSKLISILKEMSSLKLQIEQLSKQ